jgi:nucleotide-binding universal stress UspA family protein
MISLNKILVPVDFSEHSTKAVRYGAELAAKFGAELHLFHAIETRAYAYDETATYFPPEPIAEVESAALKELDKVKIEAADQVHVIRNVARGNPFVEIVRYARDNTVDLIVIGTHGRGAIAHMLLGSVAERVVRKAPCPVLVVRGEQHEFVMP